MLFLPKNFSRHVSVRTCLAHMFSTFEVSFYFYSTTKSIPIRSEYVKLAQGESHARWVAFVYLYSFELVTLKIQVLTKEIRAFYAFLCSTEKTI